MPPRENSTNSFLARLGDALKPPRSQSASRSRSRSRAARDVSHDAKAVASRDVEAVTTQDAGAATFQDAEIVPSQDAGVLSSQDVGETGSPVAISPHIPIDDTTPADATASPSNSPDNTQGPAATEATIAPAAVTRNLWEEAFEALPTGAQLKLGKLAGRPLSSTTVSDDLKSLTTLAEEKRDLCDQKTWKCEVGGHEIIIREYAARMMSGLAAIGDLAVEFIPGPAKIIWPVLKGVMTSTLANYDEQMGALLTCSEKVVRVVCVGRAYERSCIDGRPPDDTTKQLQDDLVRMYQTTLEILADAENLLSKGTCKRTMHAILFPHQTSGYFSTLAECEATVARVAGACGLENDARALELIERHLPRVEQGIENLLEHQDRETASKILNWISKTDYKALHRASKKARTAGTCQWLLKSTEFRTWDDLGASCILSLQGSPGTGKTFLTSMVVDHFSSRLARSRHEALAFFYCDRKDDQRRSSGSVLASFVKQLSSRAFVGEAPSVRSQVVELYKDAMLEGSQSMDEGLHQELLLNSVNTYATTTIILDGFDECDNESQTDIRRSLEYLIKKSQRPVKVFVSSRPNDVQSFGWPSICVEKEYNKNDIELFIKAKIADEYTPKLIKSMEDVILTKLREGGGSMFKWVDLQLRQLFKCQSDEAIHNRLNHMPMTLNGTYDEIYDEIKTKDEYDRKRAENAIAWVICSLRPLQVDELLDATRINIDSEVGTNENGTEKPWLLSKIGEHALLTLCNDLLIVDRERHIWSFAHLSALEYFEEQLTTSGRLNKGLARERVASACLQFLNRSPGYEGINPTSTVFSESSSPAAAPYAPEPSARAKDEWKWNLKSYIYKYWGSHVQQVEQTAPDSHLTGSSSTVKALKTFFGSSGESSEHYRRWYRGMSSTHGELQVKFQSCSFEDLLPENKSIIAIARLGIYHLLRDWWDKVDTDVVATTNDQGYNLLSLAAASGSIPTCQKLISLGIGVDSISGPQKGGFGSALAFAASEAHLDVVKFLVEGVSPGATIDLLLDRGKYGSALAAAMSADRRADTIVKYLVEKCPDAVNQVLCHGRYGSVLAAAVSEEAITEETISIILDAGAEINRPLLCGEAGSALVAAIDNYRPLAITLLIERGADVDQILEWGPHGSALTAAAMLYHGKWIVKALVERGAEVNRVLTTGVYPSALFAALNNKNYNHDSFFYLVSQGANIRSILESDFDPTVLAFAMCSENADFLDEVMKSDEQPTIHKVVQEGILAPRLARAMLLDDQKEVIQVLLQAGTDVHAPVWDRSTGYGNCLEAAAYSGHLEYVALLIDEWHAQVDHLSDRGSFGSALIAAVGADEIEVVNFLLERGADPNLWPGPKPESSPGVRFIGTPLMVAATAGRHDCAVALLKAGAKADLRVDKGAAAFRDALEAAEAPVDDSMNHPWVSFPWWNLLARLDDQIKQDRDEVAGLLRRWLER